MVRHLAGKLTKAQIATLNAHVDAEDGARGGTDPVSIRLATEFHILLAHMTNSPILVRYVSEVAYRCCLTLSLYSRPHSSECAINEHRAIIAALVKGDASKVMGLMHSHLDSVANRALVVPTPQRGRDLLDILAPYAEEDGGEAEPILQLFDLHHEGALGNDVKGRGRLVHDDEIRREQQRHRDHRPLPHATRQLVRIAVQMGRVDGDEPQYLLRACRNLL